ncbi:MAG: Asp-tRNA(Asn)/Glu-tRNA(Gln) amidotransferase subunit GatC [Clostridia bacterium]|nr:Asp-tRNA(Asn)/Glu-tRNA(Gln) amidotransferase subunit GatC [Clostridia bacterium]
MKKEKITLEVIDKLANLSALEFTRAEKDRLVGEVSGIIDMLDQCGNVSIENVRSQNFLSLDKLRNDMVSIGISQEDVLSSAPEKEGEYITMPKVVE